LLERSMMISKTIRDMTRRVYEKGGHEWEKGNRVKRTVQSTEAFLAPKRTPERADSSRRDGRGARALGRYTKDRAPLDEDLDPVVDKRRNAFGRKGGGQGDRNGLTVGVIVEDDLGRERDGKRPSIRAGQSTQFQKGQLICSYGHEISPHLQHKTTNIQMHGAFYDILVKVERVVRWNACSSLDDGLEALEPDAEGVDVPERLEVVVGVVWPALWDRRADAGPLLDVLRDEMDARMWFGIESCNISTGTTSISGLSTSYLFQKPAATTAPTQPAAAAAPNAPFVLNGAAKFNDLPTPIQDLLNDTEALIQGGLNASKDLKGRKLGDAIVTNTATSRQIFHDLTSSSNTLQADDLFAKNLREKVDQAVQDVIVCSQIIEGFRESGIQHPNLKTNAQYPLEFFHRLADQMQERLARYKAIVD
ncbi:1231_t:CDS:10, partial [Acaulospora colombiana]